MKTLNLVMIVKNEERCLNRCLSSVKNLVDNIIIVDTGSNDSTKEIATSFNARIYDYIWKSDFSDARNFALSKSDSDWNLILDADESLISGSRQDIEDFLKNSRQLGVIHRISAYLDHDELSYGNDYITRIIPRGVKYVGKVHEQVNSTLPRIPLSLSFNHDGYLISNKPEKYLPILMDELAKNTKDTYYLFQVASTLVNMNEYDKAVLYFREFYKLGDHQDNYYKKAIIRYVYALTELKQFDEALEIVESVKSKLDRYADFNFMCGVFYLKLILFDIDKFQYYLPQIEKSYLKCLEIGEVPIHQGVQGAGSFKAAYNLGTWYEASGNIKLAIEYYKMAANQGYDVAIKRLREILK